MPDQYCDICDFIGPREFEGDTMAAFVELHRAWHALVRDVVRLVANPAVQRLAKAIAEANRSTKADYRLLNEPKGKP